MHIAAEIALHLQRAGPALEGKHRLPVEPEVCLPEGFWQNLGNLLVLQILFRREEQLGERHCRFLVKLKLLVGVRVLAAVYRRTAERIVGIVLVEPVVLIQHRNAGRFNRGNIAECVPHHLKVVVHLAPAAHIESLGHVLAPVAAASGKLQLLKKMDMLALHLPVAHKVEGCRESGKTCADDIGGFFVCILRLFGMCECFVSSCCVIHGKPPVILLDYYGQCRSSPCVAYIIPHFPAFSIDRKSTVINHLSQCFHV